MTALVVIVGPTAAGKSDVAVELALALGGEVVSADSMQVYRGFDIGTGKLTPAQMRGVRHHLIDVAEPRERFSAARFAREADAAIARIARRGRQVIVAGGTGLYVRALLTGLFETPDPDGRIRARHKRLREREGMAALRAELERVDPDAAARIEPNDFVRTSRALEVFEQLKRPISALQQEHAARNAPRHRSLTLGLAPPRELLRERIDRRVDRMMEQGWLDEVRQLVARGHGESHPMGALGYRQLRAHVNGELDLEQAVCQTKRDTWRFARRQLNWFGGEAVTWYEDGDQVDAAWVGEQVRIITGERASGI